MYESSDLILSFFVKITNCVCIHMCVHWAKFWGARLTTMDLCGEFFNSKGGVPKSKGQIAHIILLDDLFVYRPESCRDFSKWGNLHCVKIFFKKSLVEIFKTSLQAKNSLI